MIDIICGETGKGKTKVLLETVNQSATVTNGNIVYLDKSRKHMYELNNKVRLINVIDYDINSTDAFFGFLCGIASQDNDLEEVYLDSFLTIASIRDDDALTEAIARLDVLSEKFKIHFILCVSKSKKDLPDSAKAKVKVAL